MATYEEIHGKRVETFSSDPTLDSTYEGQVWFNSTSGTLKTVVASATWSSSTPLSTTRAFAAGFGIQTASVAAGGNVPPHSNATEEYNGTGWSTEGNINTARGFSAGMGTQTAGLICGGEAPGTPASQATEEYNGTSWTSQNNLNAGRYAIGGSGTQTAGLAFGGSSGSPPTAKDLSEEYDGTSWTEGNNLNAANSYIVGTGIQTAAVKAGGAAPTGNQSENYDGTSWTNSGTLSQVQQGLGGCGVQTASIVFGGDNPTPGVLTVTENYDGSSWTTSPATLGTGGQGFAPAGTSTSAVAGGVYSPTIVGTTQEYNVSINTITAAAFSSGNSQNLNSYNRSGWGTQNAAWLAGGGYPSDKNESEEYDGTTWTEGNNLNTARNSAAVGGPQTAAIFATGSRTTNVEYYNGTSWTAQPASPQARSSAAGGGTQSSFVMAGGTTAGSPYYPISSTGEEWNGSSWTSAGALPAPQGSMNGSALGESESAAILAGGAKSPAGPPGYVPHVVTNTSLDYGGTSWTANPNINTARVSPYFFGTTSLGILAGGDTNNSGSTTAISEQWNGSIFVTGANMATARYTGGRAGTATAGLVAGGYPGTPGSVGNATEEYTGETTAVNAKTLTTS